MKEVYNEQLFDLVADPDEHTNVVAAHPDVVALHRARPSGDTSTPARYV